MRFFVQVLFDAAGAEVGKGTTTFGSMDAAEQAFHTAISSAIAKPEYTKLIAMIFDDTGTVVMRRVWVRGK